MSYRDWNNDMFQPIQNEISNDYNRIYQDDVVSSSSYQTTYSNAVAPVIVVVAVLGCGSLLFCLIVVCCCCCKRTTRGRVLVPPPPLSEPTAPAPQLLIHHTYPVFANAGPSLYPEMGPIPQEYQPVDTPYKVGTAATATATVVPDYPPSYDTDRLLHSDANAQPS